MPLSSGAMGSLASCAFILPVGAEIPGHSDALLETVATMLRASSLRRAAPLSQRRGQSPRRYGRAQTFTSRL